MPPVSQLVLGPIIVAKQFATKETVTFHVGLIFILFNFRLCMCENVSFLFLV